MREKTQQQMRLWAMLCHFSALFAWIFLFMLIFLGIPLYLPLNILVPLLIWKLKKSQCPWIDFQGKEALNFQISLSLYILFIIVISLFLVLASFGISITTNGTVNAVTTVLNSLLFAWMWLISILLSLQLFIVTFAAIKAYNGQHYRYPLTVRILR